MVKFVFGKFLSFFCLTYFFYFLPTGLCAAESFCGYELDPDYLQFGVTTVPYNAKPGDMIGKQLVLTATKLCANLADNGAKQVPRYKALYSHMTGSSFVWKTNVPGIGIHLVRIAPSVDVLTKIDVGDGYKNFFSTDDDTSLRQGTFLANLVRTDGNPVNGHYSINAFSIAMYSELSHNYSAEKRVMAGFTLETESCSESSDSDTMHPIQLPVVTQSELKKQEWSKVVSFSLRLTCSVPSGTSVQMYLSDALNLANSTYRLTTSGVDNVSLVITHDNTRVSYGLDGRWPLTLVDGKIDIPMQVGYIKNGDVKSAGVVAAQATISFVYL